MAHIEIHALSVKLAGTFEAHVFFPEQEVEKAEEKFPVLWMIHEDGTGTFDLMRHAALMEKIAEEKKMFVIAPMISHSLATNMQDVLLSMANLILQEDARIVKTGRQDSDISQRNH